MKKQENVIIENETKFCKNCGLEKPISDFGKRKEAKDGLSYDCKFCINEYQKKCYKDNPKISSKWKINNPHYAIKYRKDNAEDLRRRQIEWTVNNPNYINEYRRKRYKSDPNFKIRTLIRARITDALKRDNISKNVKSVEYLGCSFDEFKEYIEQQFLPEMNWENHGKVWEIDHIIPCASFDFTIEENLFKCFHFSNMQPLFKTTEIAESFGYIGYIGNRDKRDNIF